MAKFFEEGVEGWMSKELLCQGSEAGVLLHKKVVLPLEFVGFVGPDVEFAFELSNVFYNMISD
jgi:hypothetical protein